MKLGNPVNKQYEKLLKGKFDTTEITEIVYTVKHIRYDDGFEFYTKIKIDSEGVRTESGYSGAASDF